jgi:hypothetical protein
MTHRESEGGSRIFAYLAHQGFPYDPDEEAVLGFRGG